MAYYRLPEKELRAYCEAVMGKYGFNEKQSRDIADILLTADLQGLESHGVQRLIRYHRGVKSGVIRPDAVPEVVHETPLSVVLDAHSAMGQIAAVDAMERAIAKAKQYGFGAAVVRNSNHFGVGGYYAMMAEREDMLGMCFTNTQAICVPTFGREVMLGTNPIAFAMPADPIPMLYDVATTVVPRGKLEVYAKQGKPMPLGWAVDENGKDTSDAKRVIDNINSKAGGGILPLGGSSPATGSHKGYGLALIVEILSSIIAGGATSNHVSKNGLGRRASSRSITACSATRPRCARAFRRFCRSCATAPRPKAAPAFTPPAKWRSTPAMKSSKTASPSTTPRSRSFAPSAASSGSTLTPR